MYKTECEFLTDNKKDLNVNNNEVKFITKIRVNEGNRWFRMIWTVSVTKREDIEPLDGMEWLREPD